MAESMTTPAPSRVASGAVTAPVLLALVEATWRAVRADAPGLPAVTLHSMLDRDLGLDSLSRMELLLRVEREFGVALPEQALQRIETVGDLLQAAQDAAALRQDGAGAGPRRAVAPLRQADRAAPTAPDKPAASAAEDAASWA